MDRTLILSIFLWDMQPIVAQEKDPYDMSLEKITLLLVYRGLQGHQSKKFAWIISEWLRDHKAELIESTSVDIYSDKGITEKLDQII